MRYKNHEIVGFGREHLVLRSNQNSSRVLKFPWFFNRTSGREVAREIRRHKQMAQNSGIEVPNTRVFIDKRYVIDQEFVQSDNSVDLMEYIGGLPNNFFINRYISNKSNFVASQGKVYWIDLTYGRLRPLIKLGISEEQYYKWRAFFKIRFNI